MPKVTTLQTTYLKAKVLGSQDLTKAEKIPVPQGQEFFIYRHAPAQNQHLFFELASPFPTLDKDTKLDKVYGYEAHFQVEGMANEPPQTLGQKYESTQLIKLDVPYYSQLDNDPNVFGPGWRQCNTTSATMLADYLLQGRLSREVKQQGYPEAESLYMRTVAQYGDTIDHAAQTKALAEWGIESYFSDSLSLEDLLRSLSHGIPVMVGFAYKGSGHICCVVGHDPAKRVYLVHDPYGVRHGASDAYDVGIRAAFDPYNYETMQRIYWDMGGQAGWGRIVTKVNGQATGLPGGL